MEVELSNGGFRHECVENQESGDSLPCLGPLSSSRGNEPGFSLKWAARMPRQLGRDRGPTSPGLGGGSPRREIPASFRFGSQAAAIRRRSLCPTRLAQPSSASKRAL